MSVLVTWSCGIDMSGGVERMQFVPDMGQYSGGDCIAT
jgi:hypothetical protein